MSWAEVKAINSNPSIPLNILMNNSIEKTDVTEDTINDIIDGNLSLKININPHLRKFNFNAVGNKNYSVNIYRPDGSNYNKSTFGIIKYISYNDIMYCIYYNYFGLVLHNLNNDTYEYICTFIRDEIESGFVFEDVFYMLGGIYEVNDRYVIAMSMVTYAKNSSTKYVKVFVHRIAGVLEFNENNYEYTQLLYDHNSDCTNISTSNLSSTLQNVSNSTYVATYGSEFIFSTPVTILGYSNMNTDAIIFDVKNKTVISGITGGSSYATLRKNTTSYGSNDCDYSYIKWDKDFNVLFITKNTGSSSGSRWYQYIRKISKGKYIYEKYVLMFPSQVIDMYSNTRFINLDNNKVLAYNKNTSNISICIITFGETDVGIKWIYNISIDDNTNVKYYLYNFLTTANINMYCELNNKITFGSTSISQIFKNNVLNINMNFSNCFICNIQKDIEDFLKDYLDVNRSILSVSCVKGMKLITDKNLVVYKLGDLTELEYGYQANNYGTAYLYRNIYSPVTISF